MGETRILRGVRVATERGIGPASVFLKSGLICAVAAYEDIPRGAKVEELGKSLLMPGLIVRAGAATCRTRALLGGITTVVESPELDHDESSDFYLYLSRKWTHHREQDKALELLILQLCTEPANEAGLSASKGRIAPGLDADLVIWNPEYTVTGTRPLLYGLIRNVIVSGRDTAQSARF